MDLLSLVQRLPYAPRPLFARDLIEKFMDTGSLLEDKARLECSRNNVDFMRSKAGERSNEASRLPQLIAHRGYSASYKENTLEAFRQAIANGADAVETDLHLSKDGVIILSHDSDLKRCFQIDRKVKDCEWKWLQDNTTLASLRELLELLSEPEMSRIWLMLDIKVGTGPIELQWLTGEQMDDDADEMLQSLRQVIDRVPPLPDRPWSSRIVLGYWNQSYRMKCHEYLPEFPTTHIHFSLSYSGKLLANTNSASTMFFTSLTLWPQGWWFIRQAKKAHRPVFAWSVADGAKGIEWCIRRGLDAVIVDDPQMYHAVCEGLASGKRYTWSRKGLRALVFFGFWLTIWQIVLSLPPGIRVRRRVRCAT